MRLQQRWSRAMRESVGVEAEAAVADWADAAIEAFELSVVEAEADRR